LDIDNGKDGFGSGLYEPDEIQQQFKRI